ncbi:MAG: hypothetical protein HYY78_03675 [Betaproteobacteria bacterium]|nr:hypothetical protein [Betaproteobacteria bacterium]
MESIGGSFAFIAGDVAAKAAPDGHTLLLAHFALAITVNIASVPFDPVRDFAPVTLLATIQKRDRQVGGSREEGGHSSAVRMPQG